MAITKKLCSDCSLKYRKLRVYKQKMLCWNCYRKSVSWMPSPGQSIVTLEKALERVYEIRGYLNKNSTRLVTYCSFPSILIGHKVRLILCDDEPKEKGEKNHG